MAADRWLRDPAWRYAYRWHDGIHWTDRVADAGVVGPDPLPPPAYRAAGAWTAGRGQWIALAGAAGTFVGSLLPWVTGPIGIAISGTSGDGVLTLILSAPMALFGWLMVARRWASIVVVGVAVLTIALIVYEVVHISNVHYAGVGLGVVVCLVGGGVGLVGGIRGHREFTLTHQATE